MDNSQRIQTLNRAIAVIEELSKEREVGVSDLSKRVGINKTKTYRILSTLQELGYVTQNGNTEMYSLGLKLFHIGSKVVSRITEVREARPVLENLAERTDETVHLAVREGISVVYVDKIDSAHTLRLFSQIGNRSPAWCTGLGKALLSGVPESKLDGLFRNQQLTRFTSNTITDIDGLKQELKRAATQGYAIDNQEHEQGIHCVAAPIINMEGTVVAAMSVSWPETRHSATRLTEFRDLVTSAATDASARIGWNSAFTDIASSAFV